MKGTKKKLSISLVSEIFNIYLCQEEKKQIKMSEVLTLQKFEKLLKQGLEAGTVTITENTIETHENFDL
jgi:hypothetical protein